MDEGDVTIAISSTGPVNRSYVSNSPCSSVSPDSPSSRSEQAMVTPISFKKSKRTLRGPSGDKNERGLRQFSMRVCQKVESKGRTTYNEVADELVAEFGSISSNIASPDQQQYEEKNIRRRVYDALNVLMAMDIISKDKKEIQWKGLPRTSLGDIEELKAQRIGLRSRIEKKAAYLKELQEQCTGLENLIARNEKQHDSGVAASGGVALPFILIQTNPHATVEVEISEDTQLVHFDFNSTPFELHDDAFILRALGLCGGHDEDAGHPTVGAGGSGFLGHTMKNSSGIALPFTLSKQIASSHIPSILKGRAKLDCNRSNR